MDGRPFIRERVAAIADRSRNPFVDTPQCPRWIPISF
jgi:hypothetical protein